MCGICGIISLGSSLNEKDKKSLILMNKAMKHRGPDDEGYFYSNKILLAMRRLSIIDLETGKQPIENNNSVIVMNGEIYNYIELQKILKKKYTFVTKSDTEVALKAYQEWGVKFLNKLRGMFSIAIYNKTINEFILARDFIGIKPMYYTFINKKLIFSSELKSLLKYYNIKKELNLVAVDNYISSEYNYDTETFFKGIYKLEPGHIIYIKNNRFNIIQYWDFTFEKRDFLQNDIYSTLKDILTESVKIRLRADVPVGIMLSGGIDSNIILKEINNLNIKDIHSFTVGYEGNFTYDELDKARKSSKIYNTIHHEIQIGYNQFKDYLFERFVLDMDEPIANVSNIPSYFLFKEAKKFVKVLLTGLGGDELFYGYPRHHILYKYFKILKYLEKSKIGDFLEKIKKNLSKYKYLDYKLRNFYFTLSSLTKSMYSKNIFENYPKLLIYNQRMKNINIENNSYFKNNIFKLINTKNSWEVSDIITYFDMKIWIANNALLSTDIISMANSLEIRIPFFDIDLLKYYQNIKENQKFKLNYPKYLEKTIYEKNLEKWVLNQKKQPFKVPHIEWISNYLIQNMLHEIENGIVMKEILNPLGFEKYINYSNSILLIWRLYILEKWLRLYF